MIKLLLTTSIAIMSLSSFGQSENSFNKNGMSIKWYFEPHAICFEMSAPTTGWVAIGFNEHSGLQGAYLIMGNVKENVPSVVEYYTVSPGDYRPITSFGAKADIRNIEGFETSSKTTIKFSLPRKSSSSYQKDVKPGMKYSLIMAYSREDDFGHHSIMRTSEAITL